MRSISVWMVIGWLLATSPLGAIDLYSVSRDDATLRRIDRATGATLDSNTLTLPVPATIVGSWGLADDPTNPGRFWIVLDVGDSLHRRLGTINLADCGAGICPVVDRGDLADRFEGLAALCDGELYGVTGEPEDLRFASETLYRGLQLCSPGSCAPIFYQTLGRGDIGEAIAISKYDLFHASGAADQVFERIDLATSNPTDLGIDPGSPVTSFGQASALTRDLEEGKLLIAGQSALYELTTLGVLSLVAGALDHASNGLAFLDPPCPTLFADGFATGSTIRWSSTVP